MSVYSALSNKYQLPCYIFLQEVRDATGFDSTRSADAMAISLYATRGREVIGFEIKENRSDWLRELSKPDKAERIGKFCDYFYLVTPDGPKQPKLGDENKLVAKLEELPGTWGWFGLKGDKLTLLKKPDKLTPVPLDRSMLCSLLYATKKRFNSEAERIIEETVKARVEQECSFIRSNSESWKREGESLRATIAEFETFSGLNIQHRHRDMQKFGETVRLVMNNQDVLKKLESDFDFAEQSARRIANEMANNLAKLRQEIEGHRATVHQMETSTQQESGMPT